jgi:hypothetical protein
MIAKLRREGFRRLPVDPRHLLIVSSVAEVGGAARTRQHNDGKNRERNASDDHASQL